MDAHSGIKAAEIAEDHRLRSQFMAQLIAQGGEKTSADSQTSPPRLLVQFWDDLTSIPADVLKCMDSWKPLEHSGFKRLIFDDRSASEFIGEHLDSKHVLAFKQCAHPAMRADYFRLCFILKVGGIYVDADDVFQNKSIDDLFNDSRLKMQPLCYDTTTKSMVKPSLATQADSHENYVFYVNNNPLIAPPGHRLLENALDRATTSLISADKSNRDIQSLTGPGNLTACLVAHAIEQLQADEAQDFELLMTWESIAISAWPLSYRNDRRNWRHWVNSDD